jgi:hypothetical protein
MKKLRVEYYTPKNQGNQSASLKHPPTHTYQPAQPTKQASTICRATFYIINEMRREKKRES